MRRAGFFLGVFLVSVIATMASMCLDVPRASAQSFEPDWITVEPTYQELPDYKPDGECVQEQWTVEINMYYNYVEDPAKPMDLCVYHGKDFAFAWFSRDHIWADNGFTERGWAIALGGDFAVKRLYPLITNTGNVVVPWKIFKSTSNAIYMKTPYITHFGYDVYYEPDFTQKIRPLINADGYARRYDYTSDFANRRLNVDYLEGMAAFGVAHSKNGRWMVMASYKEMIVYDTANDTARIVERAAYYDSIVWPEQIVELAISNDGKTIALAGLSEPFRMINVTDSCGLSIKKRTHLDDVVFAPCNTADLSIFAGSYSKTFSPFSGGARWYEFLSFSNEGDSLTYYDRLKWSTITAGNMQYTPKMKYLALGDSFASGEGDITIGASHYLPGTDSKGSYIAGVPREMCHTSDRSYPFLFARDMGLGRGADMQSVACSGAVRNDLLSAGKAPDYLDFGYMGQPTQLPWSGNGPRLQGLDTASYLQEQARNDFTPGRVQQIEFVKKNHPQVATVMVSGNDLGFSDVVTACLMNLPPMKSCSYVDADGRARMAAAIRTNYEEQVRFYQALKAASPYTQYYAIGYPQFISDKGSSCWDSGGLGQKEREFIRQSVSYVNQSIRNAAAKVGIRYINIENALDGVQMCGGGEGVSGTIDRIASSLITEYQHKKEIVLDDRLPLYSRWLIAQFQDAIEVASTTGDMAQNPMGTIMGYMQQLFHPNSVGHKAIRDYVAARYGGESLLNAQCDGGVILCPDVSYAGVPPIPVYFTRDNAVTASDRLVYVTSLIKSTAAQAGEAVKDASIAVVKRGQEFIIASPRVMVAVPRTIAIHSDPVVLGEIRVGDEQMKVTVPDDLPIGFHTITLTGTMEDGRQVEYAEYVFVEGADGDIDADGIADSADPCVFATPGGIDSDQDGIDDSCDLRVVAGSGPDVAQKDSLKLNILAATKRDVSTENLLTSARESLDGASVIDSFSEARGAVTSLQDANRAQAVGNSDEEKRWQFFPSVIIGSAVVLLLALVSLIWLYSRSRKMNARV